MNPYIEQMRRWRRRRKRARWPDQVHQRSAKADGLTPADFNYVQWPLKDAVRLSHAAPNDPHFVTYYDCEFKALPPLANRYQLVEPGTGEFGNDREYAALPDPVGLCLSRVKFELRDEETGEVLHENGTEPNEDGKVRGGDVGEQKSRGLWDLLAPAPGADGPKVEVCLVAYPLFMFLEEGGGMRADYAVGNRGYFKGREVESPIYAMQLLYDGTFLLNGQPRPVPESPAQSREDMESRMHYDALVANEKAERERQERELQAELAREREELEARYAREDAEREAERRRLEAEAEAEAKRNAPYVQRNTVEPSKRDLLAKHIEIHVSWIGSTDQDRIDFLHKAMKLGGDWKAGAEQLAAERGWSL